MFSLEAANEKTSESAADEKFLPTRKVLARYDISDVSLSRWLRNERMRFPRPLYLSGRRFWKLSDLVTWERAQAMRSAK
jgi:hypothetical protein